jgi:hypothetical protein
MLDLVDLVDLVGRLLLADGREFDLALGSGLF